MCHEADEVRRLQKLNKVGFIKGDVFQVRGRKGRGSKPNVPKGEIQYQSPENSPKGRFSPSVLRDLDTAAQTGGWAEHSGQTMTSFVVLNDYCTQRARPPDLVFLIHQALTTHLSHRFCRGLL
ncbi:hypothetical protein MHYP_G00226690 [Metynnis hypsauchen]